MRHHNTTKKFGRQRGEREALMRGLVISLITHEKITTTEARAKALRGRVERLITTARKPGVATTRLVMARLGNDPSTAERLMKVIAPKYASRPGGYTRVTKLAPRSARGDASRMAVIELV
jgi:large subunit ribosomal protein L17